MVLDNVMPSPLKSVTFPSGGKQVSGFSLVSPICPDLQLLLPAAGIECFCFTASEKHVFNILNKKTPWL
jgi:hypothetical protein